jgi:thioredoxin
MVYCLSGGRSSSAASMLSKNGFSKIYDLPGIMSWRNDNYPLETAPNALPNNGLNLDAYDKLIHSKEYVLVDFNATWCKPCKIMAPYLAKHAQERNDKMILAPVDADANPEPVKSNGIDALPTLILYHNGQQIWRNTGLIEEEKLVETLAQWVK